MTVENSLSILIVTDDPTVFLTAKQTLQQENYRFYETRQTTEGLSIYALYRPALVLLDSRLPDALEMVQEIRRDSHHQPLLLFLLEMESATELINRAFAEGVDEVIPLPVHPAILTRRVHRLLAHHHTDSIEAQRFRSLFMHSRDAIYIYDLQGSLIDVNDAALRLTGHSREELKTIHALTLADPRLKSFFQMILDKIRDHGFYRAPDNYTRVTKDRREIYIESEAWYIYHEGVPTAILSVARDITARKMMEIAEREQRIMAEALSEITATLNSTLELDDVLDRVFEHAQRVVPHSCSTLMLIESGYARVVRHRGFVERGVAEAVNSISARVENIYVLNAMAKSSQPYIVKDTSKAPEWTVFPKVNEFIRSYIGVPVSIEGHVIGFINLDSDTVNSFTTHHGEQLLAFANQAGIAIRNARMYEALNTYVDRLQDTIDQRTREFHKERELAETILNSSSDAIFVTQTNGAIVQTNPAFDVIFGKQQSATLQALIATSDIAQFLETLSNVAHDSQPRRIEIGLCRADGSTFQADAALNPIVEQDAGIARHIVCSLRDISAHKQVESHLLQSLQREKELSELKSRFVTTVSHEFRTPLAVISIAGEMLRKYGHRMSAEQQHERLKGIDEAVYTMTTLLANTITINRATEGNLEINLVKCDLINLATKLTIQLQQTIGTTHQLTLYTESENTFIAADPKMLTQVIEELLTNAVKFSPGSQMVTLRISQDTEFIVLQVRDSGIGIPAHEGEHIFEPFHRADNTENFPGKGLGLTVAQHIVMLHQGNISYESREGVGSTFTLKLPKFVEEDITL